MKLLVSSPDFWGLSVVIRLSHITTLRVAGRRQSIELFTIERLTIKLCASKGMRSCSGDDPEGPEGPEGHPNVKLAVLLGKDSKVS